MKYTVISKIYDTGKADISIRPAQDSEATRAEYNKTHDLYVDVFDDEKQARAFYDECKSEEVAARDYPLEEILMVKRMG